MTPTHRSDPMTDKLREALEKLHHAVCGETGFAAAVRQESGKAYPWPALDIADDLARTALAAAPQPAPVSADERAAMIEVIRGAMLKHARAVMNAPPGTPVVQNEDEAAADALLADGWTRGGDQPVEVLHLGELPAEFLADLDDATDNYPRGDAEAGLREALAFYAVEANYRVSAEVVAPRHASRQLTVHKGPALVDGGAKARAALARPSAPETLAWAVVGEDGKVVPASCSLGKDHAMMQIAHPHDTIVRVAIRIVEDEA